MVGRRTGPLETGKASTAEDRPLSGRHSSLQCRSRGAAPQAQAARASHGRILDAIGNQTLNRNRLIIDRHRLNGKDLIARVCRHRRRRCERRIDEPRQPHALPPYPPTAVEHHVVCGPRFQIAEAEHVSPLRREREPAEPIPLPGAYLQPIRACK